MVWSRVSLLCFLLHVLVPECEMTDDPISVDCEPLCQFELLEEKWCALQRGCYEPSIKDNDALFIQCWQPCWRSSTNCLSLCRAQHATIKSKCSQSCASNNDKFCPGFCFALEIDQLVHGASKQPEVANPPGTQEADDKKITKPQTTPQGPAVTTPPSGDGKEGAATASSSE
ncbi:uncharacterized protein [Littorina saxatilis]|uniref:Uncharacterized protein n=1 Tax=Littorina saxatilis TaxID=31220 RepID=A0AAN9FZU5_9CAEN